MAGLRGPDSSKDAQLLDERAVFPETVDVNIRQLDPIPAPRYFLKELPLTNEMSDLVLKSRQEIRDVLHGRDDRLLAIVGPCSIHDPKAAHEYAERLAAVKKELDDRLVIVMRVSVPRFNKVQRRLDAESQLTGETVKGERVGGEVTGILPVLDLLCSLHGTVGVEGGAILLDNPILHGIATLIVGEQCLVDVGSAAFLGRHHHGELASVGGLLHIGLELFDSGRSLGDAEFLGDFLVPVQAGHRDTVRHCVEAAGTDLTVGAHAVDLSLSLIHISEPTRP